VARLNVSVPDELVKQVRRAHPELNISAVLQEALRAALGCRHDHRLACGACGEELEPGDLEAAALSRFYATIMNLVSDAVFAGYTVEGVARVIRSWAQREGIPNADRIPLPVVSRSRRQHKPRVT
jgi:hypothetical protein